MVDFIIQAKNKSHNVHYIILHPHGIYNSSSTWEMRNLTTTLIKLNILNAIEKQ